MKRTIPMTAATLGAVAVMAGPALGHDGTVSCPDVPGGPYVVSADPIYGTPTVTLNADGTLTLTWPDGYQRPKPAPTGCAPVPPPEPPVVAPPAPPLAPPPTVVVVPQEPPVRVRLPRRPDRPRTCANVPKGAGRAWFDGSRLGFRCPLPPRLRPHRPRTPAVTG